MDERIVISVQDKISRTIKTKFDNIALSSDKADVAITRLKATINSMGTMNTVGLNATVAQVNALAAALNRVSPSAAAMVTAMSRAQIASNNAAIAQQRLAAATAAATAAQTRAATTSVNQQTAQQRLVAAQNMTAASTNALQASVSRVSIAQTQASVSAAQLSAAQSRAAIAANNLTASNARLAASNRSVVATTGAVTVATNGMAAGFTAIGVAAGGLYGIGVGDELTRVKNMLEANTKSVVHAEAVMESLRDVSNRTATSMGDNAVAFSKFNASLEIMGKSAADTIKMIETLNKGQLIGGATAAEAAAVTTQLSQAFAQGFINGEEFNTIASSFPMLRDEMARVVAESKSMTFEEARAALKQMGSDGELTVDIMYKATERLGQNVDAKFAEMESTVAMSMQRLRNEAMFEIGGFVKSIGLTKTLSSSIDAVAENMRQVVVVGGTVASIFGVKIVGGFVAAKVAAIGLRSAIMSTGVGAMAVAVGVLVDQFLQFSDSVGGVSKALEFMSEIASNVFTNLPEIVSTSAALTVAYMLDAWDSIANYAVTIFPFVWTSITDGANAAWDMVKAGAAAAWPVISDGFTALVGPINLVALQIGNKMFEMFAGLVSRALWVSQNFEILFKNLPTVIAAAGIGAINSIIDMINKATEKVVNFINSIIDKLNVLGAGIDRVDIGKAFDHLPNDYADQLQQMTTDFQKHNEDFFKNNPIGQLSSRLNAATEAEGVRVADAVKRTADRISNAWDAATNKVNDAMRRNKTSEDLKGELAKLVMPDDLSSRVADAQADVVKKNAEAEEARAAALAETRDVTEMATKATEENTKATGANSAAKSRSLQDYLDDMQREMDLLKMLPKERARESDALDVINSLLQDGITLNDAQQAQLREKIALLHREREIAAQIDDLMGSTVYKRQQELDIIRAAAREAGGEGGVTKADAFMHVAGKTELGSVLEGTYSFAMAQVEAYDHMYAQLDEMRQQNLISEQEASAVRIKLAGQEHAARASIFSDMFGNLASLSKSGNERLAKVGQAAAIAQTMIATYQSATSAYASLAGIPVVGPALGVAAAAAAVAAGLANVQQIRSQNTQGFKDGGYTGNVGVNTEAGVVHGGEYVFSAPAVNRIGVANLEALHRGSASYRDDMALRGNEAGVTNVNVIVVASMEEAEAAAAGYDSNEETRIVEAVIRNKNKVKKGWGL